MACPVLASTSDNKVILSNYSNTDGTVVKVGCRQFGRRLTAGAPVLSCSSTTWGQPAGQTPVSGDRIGFKCEWNGDLNTYEIVIISCASAAAAILVFGILFICCINVAVNKRNKRRKESEVDSYPPSAINEKVGYAQYGNGYGDSGVGYGGGGGGGGGIRGYRPSGKYEKQIIPDAQVDPRDNRNINSRDIRNDEKRDPILWANANPYREPDRSDRTSGYQFYNGKNSSQHDNRAFDRSDYGRGSSYAEPGYLGTNYIQGKREDYRWNDRLPRAHLTNDDRSNRRY